MGSFNVTDPIIGSIHPGDPAVLVVLQANTIRRSDGVVEIAPSSNLISNDGACQFYIPIAVIRGIYDDYGRLSSVEETGTAAALAAHFGISARTLMEIITCNRESTDTYSNVSKLMDPDFRWELNNFDPQSPNTLFEAGGFLKNDQGAWVHPQTPGFRLYVVSRDNQELPISFANEMWNSIVSKAFAADYICEVYFAETPDGRVAHKQTWTRSDFPKFWREVTGYTLGYSQQGAIKTLQSLSGMWMHASTWDFYAGGLIPGFDQKSDCALDSYSPIGCSAVVLEMLGFEFQCEDETLDRRYRGIFVHPQWAKTKDGEPILVGSDGTWVRVFVGDKVYDGIYVPRDFSALFVKLCGSSPNMSRVDKPIFTAAMDVLLHAMQRDPEKAGSDIVTTFVNERLFASSTMRCQWNVVADVYHPILSTNLVVQKDLIALEVLKNNFFVVGKPIMPTTNGPQCGDMLAELNAAKANLQIIKDRFYGSYELSHPSDVATGSFEPGSFEVVAMIDDQVFVGSGYDGFRMDLKAVTVLTEETDPTKLVLQVTAEGATLQDKV